LARRKSAEIARADSSKRRASTSALFGSRLSSFGTVNISRSVAKYSRYAAPSL
jgi:hypothetical protein